MDVLGDKIKILNTHLFLYTINYQIVSILSYFLMTATPVNSIKYIDPSNNEEREIPTETVIAIMYLENQSVNDNKVLSNVEFRDHMWNVRLGPYRDVEFCECCQSRFIYKESKTSGFELGHIIARAKGGNNSYKNLRLICSGCNKTQSTKNMNSFMEEVGYSIPNNLYFSQSTTGIAQMDMREDTDKPEIAGKIYCKPCKEYVNKTNVSHYGTMKHINNVSFL